MTCFIYPCVFVNWIHSKVLSKHRLQNQIAVGKQNLGGKCYIQ